MKKKTKKESFFFKKEKNRNHIFKKQKKTKRGKICKKCPTRETDNTEFFG